MAAMTHVAAKNATQVAGMIHSGHVTHHHDQSMAPKALHRKNMKKQSPRNPIRIWAYLG